MAPTDEQIKKLLEWFVNSSETKKKYTEKRQKGLEEHHKWIQPDVIRELSDDELQENYLRYYKSGTGERQRLIPIYRDRIISDKKRFREMILYLLDESKDIKDRINQVLKGGNYHIEGIGKAIATAFLMDFNPKKYCLWNKKTDLGFSVLGWEVYGTTDSNGEAYVKVLNALNKLRSFTTDHQLSLLEVDLFLHTISAEKEGQDIAKEILGRVDQTQYWLYAPGEGARFWREFYESGIMAIGWDKLGDFRDYETKEMIRNRMNKIYNYDSSSKNRVLACYDFANTIRKGDGIFVKKGTKEIIGYGIVESDYAYDQSRAEYQHIRQVKWVNKGSWVLKDEKVAIKTLTNITAYPDFVNKLKELIDSGTRNSWIFQANPKYYDIEGALTSLTEMAWEVKQYKEKIHKGDTVYVWQGGPKAGILAVAEILSEPKKMSMYESEKDFIKLSEKFTEDATRVPIHIDIVMKKPIYKGSLINHPILSDLSILKAPQGTNFRLTVEQADSLKKLVVPPNGKLWASIKDKLLFSNMGDAFELDTLYFENEDQIKTRIKTSLKNGKHIILIGPPGTGKSKLAKVICQFYCGQGQYCMSTATSDWSTFETIGGYRPDNQGNLSFFPGIFLKCFHSENNHPINKWLIIDEINRADIDKAFGSLFSALTGDDITLPFEVSGDQIRIIGEPMDATEIKESHYIVPPDWRIIATMNTFDKTSLYEMSYAFMRRFSFIPIDVPDNINLNLLKTYVEMWNPETNEEICSNLSEIWKVVNRKRKIGPAIIEDIYKYVMETNPFDYVSPIIMYILPQFEGLLEENQIDFIKKITSLDFIPNTQELKHFASEFFGIDVRKFD